MKIDHCLENWYWDLAPIADQLRRKDLQVSYDVLNSNLQN